MSAMKEEDFIRKRCGSGNPFKVPEGYFEQFVSELMAKLPEKETKLSPTVLSHRWARMAWFAAAAAFCGTMFLGTYYLQSAMHPQGGSTVAQEEEETETENTYMDDMLDYAMVSNREIALCLTDVY